MAEQHSSKVFVTAETHETKFRTPDVLPSGGTKANPEVIEVGACSSQNTDTIKPPRASDEELARRVIKIPRSRTNSDAGLQSNGKRPSPTDSQKSSTMLLKHTLPPPTTTNLTRDLQRRLSFNVQSTYRKEGLEARMSLQVVEEVIAWVVKIAEIDPVSMRCIMESINELYSKIQRDTERLIGLAGEIEKLEAEEEQKSEMIEAYSLQARQTRTADAAEVGTIRIKLEEYVKRLQKEHGRILQNLDKKDRDISILQERIEKQVVAVLENGETAKAGLEQQLKEHSSAIRTLTLEVQKLENEHSHLSKKLDEEQQTVAILRQRLETAQELESIMVQSVGTADQKVQEADRQANEAKIELRRLRAELRGEQLLNARVAELDGDLTHIKATVAGLRNENNQLKESRKEIQIRLDEKLQALSEAEIEYDKINSQLRDSMAQLEQANEARERAQEEAADFSSALQDAHATPVGIKVDEAKMVVKKNEHTRQVIEKQKKENEHRAQKSTIQEETLKNLDDQIVSLNEGITDGNKQLDTSAEKSPISTAVPPLESDITLETQTHIQPKSASEDYPMLPTSSAPMGKSPTKSARNPKHQRVPTFADIAQKGRNSGVIKIVKPKGGPKPPKKGGQK